MSSGEPDNIKIISALIRATYGEREAASEFFREFLRGPLYVPERYQAHPMTDTPLYPNDFVNILGICSGERTWVPVFSAEVQIEQWCGQKLSAKKTSGAELLSLIPSEWWIIFNVGADDAQKEISPWEIELLKGGEAAIAEVVEEALDDPVQPLTIEPLKEGEQAALTKALREYAGAHREILRVHLVREQSSSQNDSKLLIGATVASEASEERLHIIADEIQALSGAALIGDEPHAVRIVHNQDDLTFGLFNQLPSIFERSRGNVVARLLHRIMKKQCGSGARLK